MSKIHFAVRTINGKLVAREGKFGTGKRLHFPCGFCKGWFVSRRQRNNHASTCVEFQPRPRRTR